VRVSEIVVFNVQTSQEVLFKYNVLCVVWHLK